MEKSIREKNMYNKRRKSKKEYNINNENNDKISRNNINWYPGHMFKTKREIKEILRKYRCSCRSIRCKNTNCFKKSRSK